MSISGDRLLNVDSTGTTTDDLSPRTKNIWWQWPLICAVFGVPLFFLSRLVMSPSDPIVTSPDIDLGDVVTESITNTQIVITNRGPRDIELIGWRASCPCLTVEGIPAKLLKGETVRVPLRIQHSRVEKSSPFVYRILFYESNLQATIFTEIKCNIVPSEVEASSLP